MKKLFVIICVFALMVIYLVVAQRKGNKREERFFEHFNNANILGRIEYVKIRYHQCALKIEGIDGEFYFDPITSRLNNKKIFEYFAEEGDTIEKNAHSDVLSLKKSGKVYNYKFRKPSD